MKPEETDHYIQKLLEELDAIPDLRWNETHVWNKIVFRLRFAWLLKLLPVCFILSVTTLCIWWPKEEKIIPAVTDLSHRISCVNQTDSTTHVIQKKDAVKAKHKKSSAKKVSIVIQDKILPETHMYQLKTWKHRPAVNPTYQSFKSITSYPLTVSESSSAQINLRIPQLHLINMDVTNSFNTKNLIRSLENNSNTYYRYTYNSYYAPEPFNTTIHIQQPSSRQQIIQYP